MTVSLNKPSQGATDWHTPLNENFEDIEFELNLGDRVSGPFFAREQSTPDLTVLVDAGAVWNGGSLTEVAAQSTAQLSAPASNDRIDRLVLDPADGSISVEGGTEAASPSPPAVPAGRIPIAQIRLSPSQTAITNSNLTDERTFAAPNDAVEDLKENLSKSAKEINEGVFTPGDLKFRAVDDEPTGWLQCNGQAVSRTTYADLFAAIGTTFGGGNGSSTFNVPDYRDRAVIGIATMGAGDASRVDNYSTALGAGGGEATHRLFNAEMPAHNHGNNTGGAGSHSHNLLSWDDMAGDNDVTAWQAATRAFLDQVNDDSGNVTYRNNAGAFDYNGELVQSVGNHSHHIPTDGGNQSHNNMMPFGTASILVKT